MSWLDDINAIAISQVATAAGVEVLRGNWLAKCPACNEERRSPHDGRRGCARVADGRGWRCYRCEAAGGTADLLGRILFGRKLEQGDPSWAELRAFGAARGWCSPPRGDIAAPSVRSAPPPVASTAPAYPPADDVAEFWQACRPVDAVPSSDLAIRWIYRRKLHNRAIAALDLARVIPDRGPWPTWLPNGRTDPDEWAQAYRVIVPMFDVDGHLRSLRFRLVHEDPTARKVLNPAGFGYAGLFMADPVALGVLQGHRDGWDGRLVVTEGEPDWITWSTHASRAEVTPAGIFGVLGLASGSWTADLARRIPPHSTIIIRTHDDDAGDAYAANVINTCRGLHRVQRPKRAPEVPHAA